MINKKFLPIGTVVLLKNATKKLMITGFCTVPENGKNETYDYCACLYPEGIISSNQVALFNHDQIDKVFYMGFQNEEEKDFKKRLDEALATEANKY